MSSCSRSKVISEGAHHVFGGGPGFGDATQRLVCDRQKDEAMNVVGLDGVLAVYGRDGSKVGEVVTVKR